MTDDPCGFLPVGDVLMIFKLAKNSKGEFELNIESKKAPEPGFDD